MGSGRKGARRSGPGVVPEHAGHPGNGVAEGGPGPEFLREFFDLGRLPLAFDWKIPASQRVFTVRNLPMEAISTIGFDMDYTLAIYGKLEIEKLAFEKARQQLVQGWRYPEEILTIDYDPEGVIRGLVVDRKLGNFLKMDRFQHVWVAVHGRRELPSEERLSLYQHRKIRLGQERYHSVDTLFGLPEGSLYQELVEFADAHPSLLAPDYEKIFDDVRAALDRVHRDDSLKSEILKDPERYILRDPRLAATLEKMLRGGKKLFVLTNSEWYYTDAVMSFLLNGLVDYMPHWSDYFHLIGVEARKPAFFRHDAPLVPVPSSETGLSTGHLKIFRGGNVREFEELLGARTESVLFVGDHIYGDILRSKKHSSWRTVMIVEELERELEASGSGRDMLRRIERKRRGLERRDLQRNLLQMKVALMEEATRQPGAEGDSGAELERQREQLRRLEAAVAEGQRSLEELERQVDGSYNATWGPLFRAGNEVSRFGLQVQQYACLYTSRVSNFLAYPFNKYFQSPRERMPHEV